MLDRRLVIYILLLSVFCHGNCQNLDSLKQAIEAIEDPVKRAAEYCHQGDEISRYRLDSAIEFVDRASEIAENLHNDTLNARIYLAYGNAYLLRGNFDLSIENCFKAREIFSKYPNDKYNLKLANLLGLIYFYQSEFVKARVHFEKAVELIEVFYEKESIEAADKLGRIYNNIGITYDNTEHLDEALEYYAKAATNSRKANELVTLASIYSNMGIIYIKTERFELAESILWEAFEIRKEQKDAHGLCKSCRHISNLLNIMGKYEEAKAYLDSGMVYCEEVASMPGTLGIWDGLVTYYSETGDYEKAFEAHVNLKMLGDSLFKIEAQERLASAELEYEYHRQRQQLMADQERDHLVAIIIVSILIFIVVLIVIMFFLQKTKARNQLLAKERALFEKERIELSNRQLSMRKENLENELEFKNKELTTNVMYLLKKNEFINEITDRLISLKKGMKKDNQKVVEKIIKDLQQAQDDDVWEEFELRFSQVYNDFYERLNQRFPNLTPSEKKLCAFLRLNMSSKEICALTRQSYNSLNVARARLRKKLDLNQKETNLISFLESI